MVRLAIFGFLAYVVFTLIQMQLDVNAKRRELAALEQSIEHQQTLNDESERMLSLGDDDAYIERIARDKLGFAYPDERVFIDRSGN